MNIQDIFKRLCSDPDFIEVYNDQTGSEVTKLTIGQLFSTGSLFHLVDVSLANNEVLRLTDSYFDVDYEGQTYLATGDILDISRITDEKEINNNGLTIKASNVRKEYVTMIRNKLFEKAKVKINMAFMNPNTGTVAFTYQIFAGEVDCTTINIEFDEDNLKNESEFTVNSIWASLEKNARSHATDSIHRSYVGNEDDLFFSRIGKWNSEAMWRMT